MQRIKKTILAINVSFCAICLTLVGCHFNSTFDNREIDRKDGEKIVADYYNLIKNEDYQSAYKLFGKKFFEVTDTQNLNYLFKVSKEKLGSIISYNVESWQTQTVVGSDAKADYMFIYNVKHSSFTAEETFTLEKENDTIKIVRYSINSKGL